MGYANSRSYRSVLALLDPYRVPEKPLRGAVAPTAAFREAVRAAEVDAEHDIPHLDRALIRKYVADLTTLNLL